MSRTDAWMPFYVGDYLSATGRLTTEQHGAYLLLLLDYWKNGPPPNDDAVLAQIARMTPASWRKAKGVLLTFFEERDGLLIQHRVERERERTADVVEKRSKAGKASAAARAKAAQNGNTCSTRVGTNGQQNARQSQSQSQSQEVSEPKGSSPRPWALPAGVSLQVWTDLKANRKRKRLPNTETAWKKFQRDLDEVSALTGIPPPQLIEQCAAKGWGAIYDPRDNRNERSASNPTAIAVQRVSDALSHH